MYLTQLCTTLLTEAPTPSTLEARGAPEAPPHPCLHTAGGAGLPRPQAPGQAQRSKASQALLTATEFPLGVPAHSSDGRVARLEVREMRLGRPAPDPVVSGATSRNAPRRAAPRPAAPTRRRTADLVVLALRCC